MALATSRRDTSSSCGSSRDLTPGKGQVSPRSAEPRCQITGHRLISTAAVKTLSGGPETGAAEASVACFYDEKVDVYLDGELQERPRTPFS